MSDAHWITRALLSAIASCGEPMVITDPGLAEHPVIAVNDAFSRLTGYSAAESTGRNCRFLQGSGTDPQTVRRIGRCIAERRGCIEWIVNERRDGTVFWNLLFISPVFDRDGTLLHFIGNQRDITQGPPADLPDYSLGKADMPPQGVEDFHALLLDVLETETDQAKGLEALVAAARRLNSLTLGLIPPAWVPPG